MSNCEEFLQMPPQAFKKPKKWLVSDISHYGKKAKFLIWNICRSRLSCFICSKIKGYWEISQWGKPFLAGVLWSCPSPCSLPPSTPWMSLWSPSPAQSAALPSSLFSLTYLLVCSLPHPWSVVCHRSCPCHRLAIPHPSRRYWLSSYTGSSLSGLLRATKRSYESSISCKAQEWSC